MRITRKLLVPMLLFIGLIIAGLVTYNAVISVQQFDAAELERLENMSAVFQARLIAKEDLALALASEVANYPEVQAAFAVKDRERLIELTLPSYRVIDEQFDIPQFQFHLPPATSFLRLHSLDKYGDDLSSFRFTVLAANSEKKPVSGPELGRAGLGIRGVVPVTFQGKHIGSVEFGTDIGPTLIEGMKSEFGYDMQILLSRAPAEVATFEGATGESQGPVDELLLQASTLEIPLFASATNYQQALAGQASVEHVDADEYEYAIFSTPLYDYSGNVIGVVDIISDHTVIAQQQTAQVVLSAGILLAVIIFAGYGFAFFARRTLGPIGELTSVASTIAAGDFSKRTNVKSDDELGTLAQVFDSMTAQLQELIGSLEQRVEARTKDLATVARISTVTATIRDPFEMLANMVHLTQRGFGLYHAHVFTYNKENEELQIVACGYKEGDEHEGTHGTSVIPMVQEQSLVARAARTRQPVIVNDVTKDPGWLPNPLLPDTHAEMAVPMIVGDELLGVLDVQAENVDAFTEEDANIQMTLASQVATALQNAQAYSRTQKQAELESLVNVIGQRIQRASSIEETLQTAIRELGTAIGATRVKASLRSAPKDTQTEPVAQAAPLAAEADRKNGSSASNESLGS